MKVITRVILAWPARVYPESQCGFRQVDPTSTWSSPWDCWKLQEKCQDQNEPLFFAFVDLTKAFDLFSSSWRMLAAPQNCTPSSSHYTPMCETQSATMLQHQTHSPSTVESSRAVCSPPLSTGFSSRSSWPTHSARTNTESICALNPTAGLFNQTPSRDQGQIRRHQRGLFSKDAVLPTHTEEELQRLINRFAHACDEFGLTISIKTTEVMGQGTNSPPSPPPPPSIHIGSHKLNAVDRFQYLGSTISSNLSFEPQINSRIAKASAVMSRLHKWVRSNNNLTVKTKMQVYRACVLSTLLYSSETWTRCAAQEKRLNSFHLRCLRRIISIRWQDKVPNT